ncbi:DMT family transporter [Sinorhizobium sp. BG8]|uniref:DMT family transporter n=1 Tax=Sinorhizobium sp. BG8 TaxID=2613773 RepID=UPI00193DAC94|nr:DMT family transporter [Sinorhizobium sp. BG8]QRM54936.1 DMT family transporter [Sinorhizobium sp. BG8]
MSTLTDPALHRKGLLITAIGGLALSFDIPLIRSSNGDVWSILAARSFATFLVALAVWTFLRFAVRRPIPLVPGRIGLVAGILYGINSLTFVLAVFNTSTANVVFILAFTSMFAAILSWIFLGERPSNATLLTMGAMVAGVALIVHDGFASGNIFGDLMAASSALLLASAITISRRSGHAMGLVPLVTAIFPGTIALLLIPAGGLEIARPGFILFNGLVMIPLAFFCLATGPRYLSAPEVGMFYLLETVLAPIWVWIIFAETPSSQTVVGGSILIAALLAHSLWQMRSKSKAVRAADAAAEFPFTG